MGRQVTEQERATSHFNAQDTQQKNFNVDNLDALADIPDSLRWKSLYMMLIRATMVGISNSFQILALVDALHEAGVIDKGKLEADTVKRGHEINTQIMALADEVELEIFRESRDLSFADELKRRQEQAAHPSEA
jgi:hypothetical protein